MATPKLALIPTGYKAGKLYSVLPESGVGDFTVVRATEATRVNEEGLIETMGANVPRLDYSGGGCPVLLTEPQRSNFVTYSQSFTSGWSFDDSTITENSTISPDGNINAGLLKGNTVSSRHNISAALSVGSLSVDASFSLFVKAKELKYIQIASANTTNQYVNFDAQNGIIGTVGSSFSNAKIEDYGNGWYRISVVSPNQYNGYYISLVSGLTATWLQSWTMPNNTDGLYIYGAQLEAGSYPTSYIKTSGSAVTRNGDQVYGAGDAATFNDSEGVLMMEIATLANDGQYRVISINDGTVSNRVQINITPISNQLQAFIVSGSTVFDAVYSLQDETEFNKIAVSYKLNNFSLWVNGVEVSTDTSGNTPIGLNTLEFNITNAADFYGKTSQVQYFNTVLTDSELETLTSWTSFIEMAQAQQYNII